MSLKKWFQYLRSQAVTDYKRCLLSCIEPAKSYNHKLLDCGCNDGTWTIELGKKAGNGELHGIEIVDSAREKAILNEIQAISANLNETMPYADGTFDCIHANQVIEHLADTDQFIQEIYRILKPGGYAILCTENLSSWHNIAALFFGWQPFSLANICERRFQIGNPLAIHHGEKAKNPKSWLHLRVFAYRGLRDVFSEYGFHVDHYEGSGYYPLPNFFSKLDPRHAAFLTIKVRRPFDSQIENK